MRFPGFTDEWERLPISYLSDILCGYAFDGNSIVEYETPNKLLRGVNITEGIIRHSTDVDRFISGEISPKLDKYILQSGDLVLGMDGSKVGRNSAIISEDDSGSYLVQRVCRLRANPVILSLIFHQVNNPKFHKYVDNVKTSSAIPHISQADISKYVVSLSSSTKENSKITNLLNYIDERISTQNKIIDNLQSLIKGLNDSFHDNQQGEAISFDELGHSYSGLSGKSGDDFGQGSPYITYLNVFQNNVANKEQIDLVSVDENESQNTISYGDVLFTLSSETPEETGIGCVYLGKSGKYYLNSFCLGVRITQSNKVYPPYLAHLVSSSKFRRFVYPLAQGSTRFNLQKNDFMKKKFILLPIEKQKEISKTLDALHDKLSVEFKLLCLYSKQKAYLLSSMFI